MTDQPEQPEQPSPLEHLREDWDRALCLVAHPDDIEFGAAAAVARWTAQGKQVVYVMVTSGEAGIDALPPEECRRVREAEQVASARVVGVDVVEFLGFPDGVVEYGVLLRRSLAGAIRRHRPDVVISANHRDTWGGRSRNQADHVAVGRAVLDAVPDAGNRWVFPEQLVDGLERWDGVREVWMFGSPESTHAVDTTDTFDVGVASLLEHRAYIDGLGWEDFDPREMLEGTSRPAGARLGTTYAASFEVFPTGWGE